MVIGQEPGQELVTLPHRHEEFLVVAHGFIHKKSHNKVVPVEVVLTKDEKSRVKFEQSKRQIF